MSDMKLPQLVDTHDVMSALKVTRATLFRIRKRDKRFPKPFLTLPMRWRQTDISDYINENTGCDA